MSNRIQRRAKERTNKKTLLRRLKNSKGLFYDSEGHIEEYFLIKNHDILDWNKVSKTQKMSKNFISRFSNKINWNILHENPHIKFDEEFIEEFIEFVNWSILKEKKMIPNEIEEKFKDFIQKKLYPNNDIFNIVSGTTSDFSLYYERGRRLAGILKVD